MAWRSSGASNDELVNNLKRFGVISSPLVESAFRKVDRKFFVPQNWKEMAHTDQPLKEGNVHISAPHIYGSVLEALDLGRESAMAFLNAGSGTCYLTCIAATLMGPRSSHFCIEIHDDVIEHSKAAIAAWNADSDNQCSFNIDIVRGNALQIDPAKGECVLGFDRIYVGASIEKGDLLRFKALLKPGGILVGPVEDELVKVIRGHNSSTVGQLQDQQFTQHVISPVRFSPLLSYPAIETVIPARIWHPSNHQFYPDKFRKSCKMLLLCSRAQFEQPIRAKQKDHLNVASLLPRALWLEILSYTHRDWFEVPQSEIKFLRKRVNEEKARFEKAEAARVEAEARCQRVEKERDVYKLLARGWRDRLKCSLGQQGGESLLETERVEEAVASLLISTQSSSPSAGMGHVLRHLGRNSLLLARESDADDSSREDFFDVDIMAEESSEDMLVDNYVTPADEGPLSLHRGANPSASSPGVVERENAVDVTRTSGGTQVRAVSISEAHT